MAKIILGKRPETFAHTVKFPMLDGSTGAIGLTYKYRTRDEFGEFVDGLRDADKARMEAEIDRFQLLHEQGKPIPELTQSELLARETEMNADYIMGCVQGWDLDVDFDRAAVIQLAGEVPAAIPEIIKGYRDAIVEGRLGN